jgi:hypothetical protein
MYAYKVDFNRVHNNADWWQSFKLTTDGTTPIDLGGAIFSMTLVPKLGAATVDNTFAFTMDTGLQLTTDGSDGLFSINIDHTVMETIPPGTYKYDMILDRSGASQVLMEGVVKIIDGVTDI